MDQRRSGSFLRKLRKEKELTQEQLAEHFNVSDRTVSRWENGKNMPDLSILVELADFYDVDVREIIDGERKSENMNQEEKEKMLRVAEYAENEKVNLLTSLRKISLLGICSMVVGFVMLGVCDTYSLPVTEYVMGVAFGVAFGALIAAFLYATGVLAKIRIRIGKPMKIRAAMIILAVCVGIGVLLFVKFWNASF
ncbi:MAG: helix-turn-helix domain-containing protein [Lachnospiraceae bacterium]|nr:helix-turn-helix domain-containing protein [Lachnospiraceae bacterium]